MEYAVIFFGLLSIGCTCMLFVVIGTYNKKIADIHKNIVEMHLKTLKLETDFKEFKDPKRSKLHEKQSVYKIPKKLFGELRMTQNGQEAVVKASLKVDKIET